MTRVVGMGRVVGAPVSDIAVMNSLTVNLHLMMIPFYRPDPPSFSIGADTAGVAIRTAKRRHKIVIEDGAFPSDNYAVASQLHLHGLTEKDSLVRLKPRYRSPSLLLDISIYLLLTKLPLCSRRGPDRESTASAPTTSWSTWSARATRCVSSCCPACSTILDR